MLTIKAPYTVSTPRRTASRSSAPMNWAIMTLAPMDSPMNSDERRKITGKAIPTAARAVLRVTTPLAQWQLPTGWS